MMRVASQLTFCSPQEILRRAVVEQDEQLVITRLFSLDQSPVESANTLFYDGIISTELISVKAKAPNVQQLVTDYNYIDASGCAEINIIPSDKPLVLDFGTNSIENINKQIRVLASALDGFSIYEVIAACCYYPALILGLTATLSEGMTSELMIWEKTDLVGKRITAQTQIRKIS